MLQFIIPLLLAAISGIAYIAVKLPRVYEKSLFGKIYIASAIVFLILVSWSGAVSQALIPLLPFIPTEQVTSAKNAIEAIALPVNLVLIYQFVVMGYLFFLLWLAKKLDEDISINDKNT